MSETVTCNPWQAYEARYEARKAAIARIDAEVALLKQIVPANAIVRWSASKDGESKNCGVRFEEGGLVDVLSFNGIRANGFLFIASHRERQREMGCVLSDLEVIPK